MWQRDSNILNQHDRKLALSFGALVLILMLTASGVASYLFSQLKQKQEDRLSGVIAVILGESISRVTFSGKYQARLFVEEMKSRVPELAFISVETKDGLILAHSDPTKNDGSMSAPADVDLRILSLKTGSPVGGEHIQDGKTIKDVFLPFRGGLDAEVIGVVHMGINFDEVRKEQRANLFKLLILVAVLTGAAIWGVLILSHHFGSEVRALATHLQGILNHAPVAISISDQTGRILAFSVEFEHLFGRPAVKQTLVQLFAEHLADVNVNCLAETDRQVLESGVPCEQEVQVDIQGRLSTWNVSKFPIARDNGGKTTLVCTFIYDITERKRAEEEIAWNLAINQALSSLYIPLVTAGTDIEQIAIIVLERCRLLTNSAHGFVAEIDPATGDLMAHTLTQMMQSECKVTEKQSRKIIFPRKADGLYNGLWGHALNTKEPFYSDTPVKHLASVGVPEGHVVIERFLTVPVLLAGELVGQIALSNSSRAYTNRDLDLVNRIAEFYALAIQHTRAEEEIYKLNQELEQRVLDRTAQLETANKELEAFSYSVSHDLRAPLRHIDGFMGLLQKSAGKALDEQGQHYMDTISDSANKMGVLVDDLLSFSRMGRDVMSFQQVALGNLVREVIAELEPDVGGRNIAWRIGELPVVGGDGAMLRMVLVNLISNAVKFTRPREQAQIEIGSLPGQASETVIFVRDNGVGFDMTYVDKLFGVFHRLHRADEFEGTGIGLANVRRIIVRHGGRVWAEGKVDQGATFFFSLPRSQEKPPIRNRSAN